MSHLAYNNCPFDNVVSNPSATTATGKVKHGVAGKRHRLISHSGKYIRQNRGTDVLSDSDAGHIRQWAPYGLK